jgi:hypothetical protein
MDIVAVHAYGRYDIFLALRVFSMSQKLRQKDTRARAPLVFQSHSTDERSIHPSMRAAISVCEYIFFMFTSHVCMHV